MALVGDVLNYVREAGPDPSSACQAPTTLTATTSTASGSIPAGTYYYVFTGTNSWGESLPSTETSFTLGATGQITFAASGYPPGITSGNVYIGTTPGGENGFATFTGAANLVITDLTTLSANVPPTRATGMNPDSDGQFTTAQELYRFMNDGLKHLGRLAGGIIDKTGVQVTAGTNLYRFPFGQWLRFQWAWCDGFILEFVSKATVNYNSPVSGVPSCFMIEELADGMAVQIYPSPINTGGSTTLAAPMTVTDTQATCVLTSGFTTPVGMMQVDNEVMYYSANASNVITGILRGMSGTTIVAHSTAAPVKQLNLQVAGFRMPQLYSLGQSNFTLAVPFGWEDCIKDYCLGRYRYLEQEHQEAARLIKSAEDGIKEIAQRTRPPNGPRQIGGPSSTAWNAWQGFPYGVGMWW